MANTRQRIAAIVLAVVVGVALGVAIDVWRSGGPAAWLARRGLGPPYDARGQMVDLGGRGAYIDCRGTGSPTVILESGLGADASGWGFVLDDVAGSTRVCAWDRPGLGRSDERGVHTITDTAEDLAATLAGAGVQGPYVVVGHSLGGVYARVFADRYPGDVHGIVMVDAFYPDIRTIDGLDLAAEFLQINRDDTAATAAAIAQVEQLDWDQSLAQLRASGALAQPTEILAVDQRFRYDDRWFDTAAKVAAIAEWERQLAQRFPNGRITIVADSGHVIQFDRPDAVIAAIRRIIDAARAS